MLALCGCVCVCVCVGCRDQGLQIKVIYYGVCDVLSKILFFSQFKFMSICDILFIFVVLFFFIMVN